ncbi:MAG: hypothetical protein CM15mP78_02330 [Candidatus Poseidoniales archaeon]|nr:MAG: hypothetical protein CM15mP78_02330 [Candidatus Poseidoniales archaeon]
MQPFWPVEIDGWSADAMNHGRLALAINPQRGGIMGQGRAKTHHPSQYFPGVVPNGGARGVDEEPETSTCASTAVFS